MSTRDFSWGEDGRCVRLTTYHPRSAERQEIRGLKLPWIRGPSRPVVGDLYLLPLHVSKVLCHHQAVSIFTSPSHTSFQNCSCWKYNFRKLL